VAQCGRAGGVIASVHLSGRCCWRGGSGIGADVAGGQYLDRAGRWELVGAKQLVGLAGGCSGGRGQCAVRADPGGVVRL